MQGQPPRPPHLKGLLLATFAGLVLGVLAKMADQSPIPGLGQIGTHLGFWIVVLMITSVTSPSPGFAALRSTLLMGAMVFAYYVATYLYFHVIPPGDIAVWGLVTVTAVPLIAALSQPARGDGWHAAVGTALPLGLLAAEAVSFRFRLSLYAAPFGFDFAALAVLLWVLPRNNALRIKSAALAVPVALTAHWLMTDGFGIAVGIVARALG